MFDISRVGEKTASAIQQSAAFVGRNVFARAALAGYDAKNALVNEFKKIRTEYKKIESFIEYYFQGLSRRINGPALPEIKTDDNIVNDASGLQVIEEILFDEKLDTTELKKQAKILITDLNFIKQNLIDCQGLL